MRLPYLGCIALFVSFSAFAYSSGKTGRSQSGCGSCHGGGSTPSVQLSGPTTLTAGSQGSFTLQISGGSGSCSGLDIAASGGTLTAGGPSEFLSGSEITNINKANWSGSSITYTFTATAGTGSSMTLYACGLAGCSEGNSNWGLTSMTVNIGAASSPPTVQTPASASPSTLTAGGQTTLSVLGAETSGGGEGSLTYTWSAQPSGGVTWCASNGTNAGKNCLASFASAGSYTATVTITNSSGQNVTSQTSVTVNGAVNAPVISSTTSGSQTATSVQLNVSATDPMHGTLTYAWTSVPSTVNFQNSSLAATTATFSAPGTYQFSVSVTGQGGSANGNTSVPVTQQAASLVVTCSGAACPTPSVVAGASQAFGANQLDQFGGAMGAASGVSWTASGDGTIDANGNFTAGAAAGSALVTAAAGSLQGQSNVTVLDNPNVVVTTGTTSVQWLQPSAGVTLSSIVKLRAAATDPTGIASVTFGMDGSDIASIAVPSYELTLDTTNFHDGSHTLTARATNAGGSSAVASLPIQIANGAFQAQSGCSAVASAPVWALWSLAWMLRRRRAARRS
jgi:hypothetical protein